MLFRPYGSATQAGTAIGDRLARCVALLITGLLVASANSLEAAPVVLEGHDEYVYMTSVSLDGRLLVTASGDNTAIVWNVANRESVHVLDHDAAVYAAVIDPQGKQIATATGDGHVTIWNARSGTQIRRVKGHTDAVYGVAFSPDGKLLASAGGSTNGGDTTCRLWRSDDLTKVAEFAGHSRQVYGVAFSPDGKLLATSSSDKTIRLWDVTTREFRTLQGHTSDVYRCRFSPDGKRIATASQDGSVRIWSVHAGNLEHTFEGTKNNPSYAVVFSPDGRRLAAVGDDHRLRSWSVEDFRLQSDRELPTRALYAVAYAPGQSHIVVAGEDGNVYLIPQVAPAANP